VTVAYKSSQESFTYGAAPGGLPLLGHVMLLWRRPLQFLTGLPARGDLVEFRIGVRRAYIACHLELVHQVLRDSRTFDKGGPLFEKARLLVGNGLVSSEWADHRQQRRLVQPAFHHARMPGYTEIMGNEIDSELSSWRSGQVFSVSDATHTLTMRITARTMFATRVGAHAAAEVTQCMPIIMRGVYKRMFAPISWWEKVPSRANRRFEEARSRLREVISQTISDYRKANSDQGDVLSILVNARDEDTGQGMTDQEIHDQVMTILIGGTETTGNTLAWTFYLLAEHPEIEERLHAEVDDVLGGRPPRFDDLPDLDYTRRVLTETLRMYPPAWLLSRTTSREVDLADRRLPPGTPVFYSPYMLGRNPDLFPDPDRYDPDRWLPDRAASLPRDAVLPFGGGSRKCIGDDFGMAETTLTLAAATSRWRLRPVPETKVSRTPKASLGTGPLPMAAQPRSAAAEGVAAGYPAE
jgi:cytochrome P450